MTKWVEIDEPHDLSSWQLPLRDAPAGLAAALSRGVQSVAGPFVSYARLCDPGGDGVADGVWRHPDGTMSVACTIPMPGVKAAMWDWWFGWHSLSSVRYRLWHPTAHVRSQLLEDRRHLPLGRPRYVGNISAVDEYIGTQLTRLAIAFVAPARFGMDEARVDAMGTAVCAIVSLRTERMTHGKLVHLIEDTAAGCVMHSRFHLGEFRSELPLVGPLISAIVDRPRLRRRLVSNRIGLALLQHCFEEMHHLAGILPDLYRVFGED